MSPTAPAARLRRPAALALAAGLAMAGMGGCPAGAAEAVDLTGVTLRVGIFYDVTRAEIDPTDFLKGTPYKITWARLNGAGPTVKALGGNAIDLSWGLSDTAAPKASAEDKRVWTAQDAPLKIIALLKPYEPERYPGSLIAAHRDAGIRTMADVRGKTYAFNEGGNANAIALLALDHGGLARKDVQVRLLQSDSLASAVISGAVQAASVSLWQVGAALDDGTIVKVASDQEVGFPGYVSVTARTESIEDPKLAAAIADFLTRIARFSNWAARHPEEVARAYATVLQLKPDQALLAARSAANTLVTVHPGDEAVKREIALAAKLHQVGFLVRPIDFTALIDDRFSAAIDAGNQ